MLAISARDRVTDIVHIQVAMKDQIEPVRPPLIKLKLADPINACHVPMLAQN